MKNEILQMTSTLENSDTKLHFNYAENLDDERGITFGCIGFCTGTYDGNILIKHYTESNPDNTLAKYIPALDKIDAGPHDAAGGDGNPNVEGLSGFIQDINACDDPLFKKAQMDKLDEFYYNPAMEIADSIGAKNALTKAFIYDMCVRHGVDGAENIIKDAGTTPKEGAGENTYLTKLISLRDAKLKQEGLGDVNRNQGYKNVLNSGNVNLKTPFTFVAYGDDFVIDGNLDLGDNSSQVGSMIAEYRMKEAAPATVFKTPEYIDVGGMNSKRYRDLIQVDLSKYTSDSKISKAVLSLCWYYPANVRSNDTVLEVYRPVAWNPEFVSWNNKDNGIAWSNAGGDWYDSQGVLQGSTPYTTITLTASKTPDNAYHELDITQLIQEYASGKYVNTGLLLKAKNESGNYVAFYSSKMTNGAKVTIEEKIPIEDTPTDDTTTTTETIYLMVKCNSLTEAQALSPKVQGVIGDKTIEIYSKM